MAVVIIIFVLSYLGIIFNTQLGLYLSKIFKTKIHVNKVVPVLIGAIVSWTYVYFAELPMHNNLTVLEALTHHLKDEITPICAFLLFALWLVGTLEERKCIHIVKDMLPLKKPKTLMWFWVGITFFCSALLDNATTTKVMVGITLLIFDDKKDKLVFTVLTIIAANAGGAWSPLGDVTTTMLWIEGLVTPLPLIKSTFLACVVQASFIPLFMTLRPAHFNRLTEYHLETHIDTDEEYAEYHEDYNGKVAMLIVGMLALVLVPILKIYAHMEPWQGMMMAAFIVFTFNEVLNKQAKPHHAKIKNKRLYKKLQKEEIIFVFFILTLVSVFPSIAVDQDHHMLSHAAGVLKEYFSLPLLGIILGIISAVIDNVPMMSAGMDMFSYPPDHWFWHFLAYAIGTGGSVLIIGSLAGIIAIGILRIEFMYYLKNFSLLIFLSYLAGAIVFMIQNVWLQ